MKKPINYIGSPIHKEINIKNFLEVTQWLHEVQQISPDLFNWVGVYYKASYLIGENSTDLILGPFIGEETEHIRIPLERGLCGLALREERIVNQADVHADERHIACSLKTKSELIVPIADRNGDFVAEIDIDSNTLNAFSPELEQAVKEKVKTFPLL